MSRIQKGLFAHWSLQVFCGENCSVQGSPVPACRHCKLYLQCSGDRNHTPNTEVTVLFWGSSVPHWSLKQIPQYFYFLCWAFGDFFPEVSLGWDENQQENHLRHSILLPAMGTGFIFHLPHRSSPRFSAVPRPLPPAHSTFVLQEELPLAWICIPHSRRVRGCWSQPLRCSLGRRALLHILSCILIIPRKLKSPFSEMVRVKKGKTN